MKNECNLCDLFGKKNHCFNCKIANSKSGNVEPKEIDSFENLIASLDDGTFYVKYNVGDYKNITLLTGEEVRIFIIGIDHDMHAETGEIVPVTFGILSTGVLSVMNYNATNYGSYMSSHLRNVVNGYEVLMPDVIKDRIVPVLKKTSVGNGYTSIVDHAERLFAFSEVEIIGKTCYSYEGEGERYSFFGDVKNYKYLSSKGSHTTFLRSPYSMGCFATITNQGYKNYYNADHALGIAFGFCFSSNFKGRQNDEQ